MNVQKVYEPITDVSFDSEVSDKDFICQSRASSRITRGR